MKLIKTGLIIRFSRSRRKQNGFSLVEVVLAIAVVALSLISIVGLLTVSLSLNNNTTSQTTAIAITSSIIDDVRSTPATSTSSIRYLINISSSSGVKQTLYFDVDGNLLTNGNDAVLAATITFNPPPANVKAATMMEVMVYWPVTATGVTLHHIEATSVLDRN